MKAFTSVSRCLLYVICKQLVPEGHQSVCFTISYLVQKISSFLQMDFDQREYRMWPKYGLPSILHLCANQEIHHLLDI